MRVPIAQLDVHAPVQCSAFAWCSATGLYEKLGFALSGMSQTTTTNNDDNDDDETRGDALISVPAAVSRLQVTGAKG